MTQKPMRAWCATYQWPGKERFLAGTVWVRSNAPYHEIEAELESGFWKFWDGILPDALPRPKLVSYQPGQIIFLEDSELERTAA